MRKMQYPNMISLSILGGIAFFLIFQNIFLNKSDLHSLQGCLLCHTSDQDPSKSHPVKILGCTICHMGNPFSRDKELAHRGMVRNPGDLQIVEKTCGQAECHPDLPKKVKNSLMATNRGILSAMQKQWPHEKIETVKDVYELTKDVPGKSKALDHYRKMCGGCHLWRHRYPGYGEIGKRGGGCADCHIEELDTPNADLSQKKFYHPALTTKIPSKNCLKCHNRSARIGLSYMGRFESEGYATPFTKGGPGSRQLSGGRFYIELPGDVHHEKADMDCIDCHTEKGIMGDGTAYQHQSQQVDITCKACHKPVFRANDPDPDLTGRLVSANNHIPLNQSSFFAISSKESHLYNLHSQPGEKITLYRKRDGKPIKFASLSTSAFHTDPLHKRLACQACHSRWIPQCYGCHETLFGQADQRGWLTGKKMQGKWNEGRGYIRFLLPTLGIWQDGRIGPFAPGCQVFIQEFDSKGVYRHEQSSQHLVMADFDPHTTACKTPDCETCHINTKSLGLGTGSLKITHSQLEFNPVFDSAGSGYKLDFPLDAFVSPQGKPLQSVSHPGSRPFNIEELQKITKAGLCLPCHDSYDDKIYTDFTSSFAKFIANKTKCAEKIK